MRLSPFLSQHHCATCTCVYLYFYFAIIYCDTIPCCRDAKNFFSDSGELWRNYEKVFISDSGEARSKELFFFSQNFFAFCTSLKCVAFRYYRFLIKNPTFSTSVAFVTQRSARPTSVWFTSTSSAQFFVCVGCVFSLFTFEIYPNYFFKLKGLLPTEELAKAIAWILNCKFLVISVTNITGFAVMPTSSLSFDSGSINPEINFIFTNFSSWLASVLSVSMSH